MSISSSHWKDAVPGEEGHHTVCPVCRWFVRMITKDDVRKCPRCEKINMEAKPHE